jgi:CheY-like chemotaxis protein
VLLLTGAFEPIDEGRAREVGCDGVLVKPFEPQMVISRVKELLSGKRPPKVASPDSQQTAVPPAADTLRAATMNPRPGGERTATDGGGSIEDYFDRLDAAFGDGTGPQTGAAPAVSATDKTQPIPIPSLGDELASWDPDLSTTASSTSDTVLSLDDLKDDVVPPDTRPSADASMPGQAPQTFSFAPATPVAAPAPPPSEPEAPRSIGFAAAAPVAPAPASGSAPPVEAPPAAAVSAPTAAGASIAPAPAPAPSLAQAFATLLAAEQGKVSPTAHGAQQVTDDVIDQVTRRVIEQLGDRSVRDIVLEVAERLVREEIERIKSNAR